MRFSLELFPPIDAAEQAWRRPSSRLHSSFSSPPSPALPASFSPNLIERKKRRGARKEADVPPHPSLLPHDARMAHGAWRMSEGGRRAGRGELSVAIYSNCCCLKKKESISLPPLLPTQPSSLSTSTLPFLIPPCNPPILYAHLWHCLFCSI